MPGRNCVFPQCGAAETSKYKDVSFIQVPTRQNEFYTEWRKNLTEIIFKYRIDPTLRDRITAGKVHICSRHFEDKDFEVLSSGKRVIKLGALPTTNLPIKTHDTGKTVQRRHIDIVKDHPPVSSTSLPNTCYKSWKDFCMRVQKLKLNDWQLLLKEEKVILSLVNIKYKIPKFEIVATNENLSYSIIVFGWGIPADHILYVSHKRSMNNTTLSLLLHELKEYSICPGVKNFQQNTKVNQHIIPCNPLADSDIDSKYLTESFHRHVDCYVLIKRSENICLSCSQFEKRQEKSKKSITPAKPNAPLCRTNPERINLALKEARKENKILNKKIKLLKAKIVEQSVEVDFGGDIDSVLSANKDRMNPFMKLFWEEQKKLACKTNKTQLRYHPMLIRFCLSIYAKSASAYEELRSSNILTLPSKRTLRDYRNAISPKAGFNENIVDELRDLTKSYKHYQKFVAILFDEITIKQNLVFDKNSKKLIGFVDLGDPDLNYAMFDDSSQLASHVLVYYVRGLASSLKFNIGYFATKNLKAYQIMSTFWEAVAILEISCSLSVVVAISDGAAMNRRFFKMHQYSDNAEEAKLVYKSINVFSNVCRFIWFIADPPHLIKTARNCLAHSGPGYRNTRRMWNCGKEVLWSHICEAVNDDLKRGLKLMPKLSLEHIQLNSYSVMNVRLASQVLSETMAKVITKYYPEKCHATAMYCEKLDKFFDCMNVRNHTEGLFKRKEFLKPYFDKSDARLDWLKHDFLQYFESWKTSINTKFPTLGPSDREKMFISHQTYEGFILTVNSVTELVPYLLSEGMPYVLTNRLNQDCLEEYFGRQRSLGRRNANPNLQQFGYNSNVLRIQRSIAPVTGNTEGRHKRKQKVSWNSVVETALPKRKSKSS